MLPDEAEQLFAAMKTAHPNWTPQYVSGYVHGAQDEGSRRQPKPTFITGAKHLDHYALGYLNGFATHRGPDAELEPRFGYANIGVGE
jgi:hypothetical protein